MENRRRYIKGIKAILIMIIMAGCTVTIKTKKEVKINMLISEINKKSKVQKK